jgi:hypothetical protein
LQETKNPSLQTELSELSSITREELRDVCVKIDESLSDVDLRELKYTSAGTCGTVSE